MAKSKLFRYEGEEFIFKDKLHSLKCRREKLYCKNDIVYFAENYCYIITDNGKEKINLRSYQKDFLKDQDQYNKYMMMCSRQVGKSTIAAVLLSHYIIFNPNKFVGLISKDKSGAKEIIEKIKVIYSMLPKWLQRSVVNFGKENIELSDNVRVKAFAAQSSEARGYTMDFLYLDEFAIIHPNIAENFMTSIMPTVSSRKNGKVLITTTPKGYNHFYDMWQNAKDVLTESDISSGVFKRMKVTWKDVYGEDYDFKRKVMTDLNDDEALFKQEFEAEFISSFKSSLFNMINGYNWWSSIFKKVKVKELNQKLFDSNIDEDIDLAYFYQNSSLIKDKNQTFIGSIDVANGLDEDYTVFNVIKLNKEKNRFEQYFKYSVNNVIPREFAFILNYIIKELLYNNLDKLFIENMEQGGGMELINELVKIDDFYEEKIHSDKTSQRKKLLGNRTTKKSKKQRLSNLKFMLKHGKLIIHDKSTLTELTNFVKDGKSFKCINGFNDDEVSSLWNFAEILDDGFYSHIFSDLNDVNYEKKNEDNDKHKYVSPHSLNELNKDLSKYKNVIYEDNNIKYEDVNIDKDKEFKLTENDKTIKSKEYIKELIRINEK